MKPELEKFLKIFKNEVDEIANQYFETAKNFAGKGISGYSQMKLIIDPNRVDKSDRDYSAVYRAFTKLSHVRTKSEYRKENDVTGELSDEIYIDEKGFDKTETMKNIIFNNEDIEKMAKYIIEDDHARFLFLLKNATNNRSLADRYTTEIFGKSIKHY